MYIIKLNSIQVRLISIFLLVFLSTLCIQRLYRLGFSQEQYNCSFFVNTFFYFLPRPSLLLSYLLSLIIFYTKKALLLHRQARLRGSSSDSPLNLLYIGYNKKLHLSISISVFIHQFSSSKYINYFIFFRYIT